MIACSCCLWAALRRLMRNSEQQTEGAETVCYQHTLLAKAVADGSRLLPGGSVRDGGRVVARPRGACGATTGTSDGAERERGAHAGTGGAVAALAQRTRLLALRPRTPAPLLPSAGLSEPVQSARAGGGAGLARSARGSGRSAGGSARPLSRAGHDADPGGRAGTGVPAWALRGPGLLRTLRLQDGVGLRLQGRVVGHAGWNHHRLRPGP